MSRAEEIRKRMVALEQELAKEEAKEGKVTPISRDRDEDKVIEGEVVNEETTDDENEEGEEQKQGDRIVTLIQVGYTESGRPFFNVDGDINLFVLDGLIDYAQRQLDKEWELREIAAEEARQRAIEEAKRKEEENRKKAIQRSSRKRGRR